jgi:hypothetical protein
MSVIHPAFVMPDLIRHPASSGTVKDSWAPDQVRGDGENAKSMGFEK